MSQDYRRIFFVNRSTENVLIGKKKSIWGLPLWKRSWDEARSVLQEVGFSAGAETLFVSGPYAHFRAIVGSSRGIYYDDSPVWPYGRKKEVYPVRFELTEIQDINNQ